MRFVLVAISLAALAACALPFSTGSSRGSALEDGRPSGTGYDDDEPVAGDDGCTLTQGYWKNHEEDWPLSTDTDLCGRTWLDALHTPPSGGDALLILGHQYIAARLNVAAGAAADGVGAYLDEADALLADCVISSEEHDRAIEVAGALDDYNNGRTGPGHCDDGPPSEGEGEGCVGEFCAGEGEGEGEGCVGELCGGGEGEGEGESDEECENPTFIEGVGRVCR